MEEPPPEIATKRTRQGQLLKALIALASAVIILSGIHSAADLLIPIFIALVSALLFSPLYAWMLRRGAPTWLAIVLMLVFLVLFLSLLVIFLAQSLASFNAQVDYYVSSLSEQLDMLRQWLTDTFGLDIDLNAIVSPDDVGEAARGIAARIVDLLASAFIIGVMILFFLAEGSAIMRRLRASAGPDNPQVTRLTTIGTSVITQFGVRTIINGTAAIFFTIVLLLLGVDFPYMWGFFAFLMGFVPYIGMILAIIPPAILALAEHGWPSAAVVIIAMIIIDGLAENLFAPMLMSRSLRLSPAVVFLSFVTWTWVLGPAGAFLALPITFLIVAMISTFPETQWLADIMVLPPERKEEPIAGGETQAATPP